MIIGTAPALGIMANFVHHSFVHRSSSVRPKERSDDG